MKSAYQTPITIKDALERVHRHDYVLPAIQREFVWEPDQICRLFDSLMRGYPIGTFLFWNVQATTARDFQFYDVVQDYHQLKNPHSQAVKFPQARDVVAILDGQQRLTALNIGLCGSFAEKLPRKRLDPYPTKRLYLDLCHQGDVEEDMQYRLAFLSDEDLGRASNDAHWYPVSSVLHLPNAGHAVFQYVQSAGLASHESAFLTLASLHQVVHDDGIISYYLENSQELDKVLDIFIRVNSGGTVLSKSDLLLSVATAQFQTLDAREEVHGLVDDLNATGHGFNFSKDLALKSGLVLSDVSDIAFRVQNFNARNIALLEAGWPRIDQALRLAAKLLASFGFSASTLKANTVLIPIAHYLHSRQHDDGYLTQAQWRDDREALRRWTIRSLVKPGIWGSGLDSIVTALRQVINESSGPFPVDALEIAMSRQGKSLRIDDSILDDLVEIPYRDKRVFAVLSRLYPGVDTRNEFHIDHVFPKSLFTPKRLEAAGIDLPMIDEFRNRFDRLPNLQLLEGPENQSKRNRMPSDWAKERYPDEIARTGWLAAHDLHDLPVDLQDFPRFYEARRSRMRARLAEVLGADTTAVATSPDSTPSGPPSAQPKGSGPMTDDAPSSVMTRSFFSETLADLVTSGRVAPGTRLSYVYRGTTYAIAVNADGTPVADGRLFESLSEAARLLTGQASVNGWLVWKLPDGRPVGDLRER